MMNTSLVLIRPQACREKFLDAARDHFYRYGVRVDEMMLLTGAQVKRGAYVERHYSSVNALAACSLEDLAAFMSDEASCLFFGAFGELWDTVIEERRVLTPADAMSVFGFTPEELDARWWASGSHVRLEYGAYVSFFGEERMYVLNGFYPRLLESFTAPGSQTCLFIVSWPESRYTWNSFRLEVIGAADPSEAESTSLRRLLYDNWELYGLSEQPSFRNSGLDAASGPFEALAQRFVWMHRRATEDDFGRALLQEGVALEFLDQLITNPTITYGGKRQQLFELLENMQSSEVLHHVCVLFAMEKEKMAMQVNDTTGRSGFISTGADWTIVLDDEDADERMNRALVFVKPHANTPETRALVEERLMQVKGMQLVAQRHVSGDEIALRRIMDKHYKTISRYAVDIPPASITVSTHTNTAFREAFDITWKEALRGGRVWNAETAIRALGDISSEELYTMWCLCTKTVKLASGAYVARLCNENVFVINGFYPYLRDAYCSKSAIVTCYLLSWQESSLPWRTFREEIVGSTNPAKAHPNSLRGLIRDRWQGLGLKYPLTTTDNAVHASAGPLEALLERHLWTCVPLSHDPLMLRLQRHGLTGALLYRWGSNPEVVLRGGKLFGSVFDLLENMQTSEMVDVMREAEQQALALCNEKPMNRAVVILQPFATNDRTIDTVKQILKQANLTVFEEVILFSDHVVKCYLESAKFSEVAHFADATSAVLQDDVSLSVKKTFEENFGSSWDFFLGGGKLIGATDACVRLKLTPVQLLEKWEESKPTRIGPACHVARLTSHDVFVINGFVPFLRESYGRPGNRLCVFKVEWRESLWTWHDFCEVLIGDPADPRLAAHGSLQRIFADEWCDYGLQRQPASRATAALYASGGPLEAAADRAMWLGVELSEDPFVQHLLLEGVPLSLLLPYVRDDRGHGVGERLCSETRGEITLGDTLPRYTRSMLSRHQQSSEVVRRLKALNSRFTRALKMSYAFIWVKPHACTTDVLEWIPTVLYEHRIEIISSGQVAMNDVIGRQLVDQQYNALYRNAIGRSVSQLPITTKQMVEFERNFNISWSTVINLHMIINAAQAVERMGVVKLLEAWETATRKVCLSPDLYVAYLEEEGLYVVNGFYPYLRSRLYTGPSIHWYVVMWDGEIMTWSDFQTYVIGAELPSSAAAASLRHGLWTLWAELGLQKQPDGIDNGFHASASPIEGVADRVSWLGLNVEEDVFGRLLIESGVSADYLRTIVRNPLVRHRDESIDAASDVFGKLCTENPLLVAQLIGLQMSGGMHILSSLSSDGILSSIQFSHSREGSVINGNGGNNNIEKDGELEVTTEFKIKGGENVAATVATTSTTSADGDAAAPETLGRNYAFLLVNPKCVTSEREDLVSAFITDFLSRCKIRVDVEGSVKSVPVALRNIIDNLSWGVAKYAVKETPSQYAIDSDAMSAFYEAFGEPWDPDKVFNAVEAAARFKFSAKQLQEAWENCRLRKRIAPFLYVGKMRDYDLYIVNGFALHSVEVINLSSSVRKCFFLSWSEADLDYTQYLHSVIGDPYLEEPPRGSLHGVLLEQWKYAGFQCPPDPFEGAVITSTSALDAIRHRKLWLSLGLLHDPVGGFAIKKLGVSPYSVRWAVSNPRTLHGDRRYLLEKLYGQGSGDVLRFLVDEDTRHKAAPLRNSAFVLVKSHALCRPFAMTMEMVFANSNVRIDEEGDISGSVLRQRHIVHYLYPTALKYAGCDVSTIRLSQKEEEIVRKDLGISWQQLLEGNLIKNAYSALELLGNVSPQQLYELWKATPRKLTLRPDFDIAELPENGIFVINAFFPALKHSFESGTSLLHWYVVSWPEESMEWSTFAEKVIGDEYPQMAQPQSVRGNLFRRWREYGLLTEPDQIHNGVHVSQGALQAMRERVECLCYALNEDYLADVILRHGVPEKVIRIWLDNPEVLLHGVETNVFEHLRHCGTSTLLTMLMALTEDLRCAEEKKKKDTDAGGDTCTMTANADGRLGAVSSILALHNKGAKGEQCGNVGKEDGFGSAPDRLSHEVSDALLFRNTAMILVKPHASDNLQVLALLESVLAANNIRVKQEFYKKSSPLLVERHLLSSMYYAKHNYLQDYLEVTKEGRERFFEVFGEEWESVVFSQRVLGAFDALARFSMTPSQLYVKWSLPQQGHVQLAHDMEVMKFHAENVYVVNALVPFEHQRMVLAEPEMRDVHCYVVSWDQRDCSWRKFLCEIIGDVDPAVAAKTSLRGRFYDKWEEFGFASRPNRVDNVLLASGGPLQAFMERDLWCSAGDIVPDPLVRAICFLDLDPSQLLEWKENPLVQYVGGHAPDDGPVTVRMFGFTYEMDTKEFVSIIGEHEGFFVPILPPCEMKDVHGRLYGSPGGANEKDAGQQQQLSGDFTAGKAALASDLGVCGTETSEWVQKVLLDPGEGEREMARLWEYYGGSADSCGQEHRGHENGNAALLTDNLRGGMRGTINGKAFKRDIETLDCFGLPLAACKVKKIFQGMAQRGDNRMTYDEFCIALAVLRQM